MAVERMMDGTETGKAGIRTCNACGGRSFTMMAQRGDGVNVLECTACGMGVVKVVPADLDAFYDDAYYGNSAPDAVGYDDYAFTAEHGVAWAAALVQLLKPGGRILDIGCVDGALLRKLPDTFDRYGIEVNTHMAERAAEQKVWVIGKDLLDPRVVAEYRGHFDIVTSIAVFEHLKDFRRGIEVAIELLKDDGVLLFEVPYISAQHENKVWFESSLEHVFYPSGNALRHLVETELGAYLAGGELYVRDYASTYIGVIAKDFGLATRIQRLFERLTQPDQAPPTAEERRARQMLLLVHAAESSQNLIADLSDLSEGALNRPMLQRLEQLWGNDLRRLSALRLDRAGLIEARDHHAAEAKRQEHLVKEGEARNAELRRSQDELRQRLARLQSSMATLQSDQKISFANLAHALEIAETRDSKIAKEAEAMREELAAVRGELERITHSTAWKATYPARRLIQRHPAIGRLARRTFKLLWWAARLQLLSRLRQARRQRALAAAAALKPAIPPVMLAKRNGMPLPIEVEDELDPWPMDRPLVSVVIPCFNYGRFVAEAVDSVLAQTFTDLEIIVVEGGSTSHESRKTTLALDRPRTRIIAQDGPHFAGANRNFGISQARGKYICCLDADDRLHPTYIEKAVFLLEAHGYDAVSTAIQFFGNREDRIGITEAPTLDDMLDANHMLTCAVFRRSLWRRAGGYRDTDPKVTGYVFEDWGFWLRLAALGARLFNINGEALFLYRSHGPSVSTQKGLHPHEVQRALVREMNADLLASPGAVNWTVHLPRPIEECRDLLSRNGDQDNHRPTILLALPFLIVGGAERLLSRIVGHLVGAGWRVLITTSVDAGPEHGDTTQWFEESTAEIYHLPHHLAPERWQDFVRYLILSRRVDLLWIVGSAFVYDILPALKREFGGLKTADLLFNTVGHVANNRKHAELIDLTFVENLEVLKYLRDAGESDNRIALIPSGVDLQTHRPSPRAPEVVAQLAAGTGELIVGFSGRWSEEKDPLAFIEIARRTPSDLPVRFVMTGTGGMRGAIEAAVTAANFAPGRFHLVGEVADVAPYLRSYDILVLPSQLDGRPVVVLEALAYGAPVVASRVGALPELVQDGGTGFLCAPGDIDAFVAALTRLTQDRDLLARMKRAARSYAEQSLDARDMMRRYQECLHQLVEPASAGETGRIS